MQFEAKLPQDLFSAETIASGAGKPITDGHPLEGFVTAENYQRLAKGAASDVREDGGFLAGLETIYDPVLRADVEAGKKREISIGFEMILDETPGEYQGQRYDAIQRNIRINHIAHVEKGRAGESVKVHLDSGIDFAVQQDPQREAGSNQLKTLTFRTDDGKDIQVPEEIHPVLMGYQAARRKDSEELAKLQEQVSSLNAQLEAAKAPGSDSSSEDVTALKSQIESLSAAIETMKAAAAEAADPARVDAAVRERLQLAEVARAVIPEVVTDGLSAREIKLAVIGKVLPFDSSIRADSLDAVTIDARFAAAREVANQKAILGLLGENKPAPRVDAAEIEKLKAQRSAGYRS